MKIRKMPLVGMFILMQGAIYGQSEIEHHAAIGQTLNYYLNGGTNGDFNTLSKAFHSTATMKFIADGNYTEVNALEFFKERMKSGAKQDRQTRIISIDISGHAASAKLEIEYPEFFFIDYMNLLLIDGEWKIVGKIFYRKGK